MIIIHRVAEATLGCRSCYLAAEGNATMASSDDFVLRHRGKQG